MEFNPTYDYGKNDLQDEKNLAFWNFGELIKTLITLSSNSERQAEIIGYGAICDEMAIDFESYFTSVVESYINFNLLTNLQLEKLNELDLFLDNRSEDGLKGIWNNFSLDTSQEWELIRVMAKDILELLEMGDLKLEIKREEIFEETNQGKKLIMQVAKIELIKVTDHM